MNRIRRFFLGTNGLFLILTAAMLGVASTPYWAFAQTKAATPKAKPVAAQKPIRLSRPIVGSKLSLSQAFKKSVPVSVEDLTSIEDHVQKLIPKLRASTVGVRIGRAQGSGVIISKDGYVLTAAHVSGAPGRSVILIMPNGKQLKGTSLGLNKTLDAGLIKITDKGNWPFLPIGDMKQVKMGDWCIATGHPGGFRPGRTPVVRLGRVILASSRVIHTDAVLVGGDSGGPLFDMHGRVIGINSRIGRPTTFNFHVPISAFSSDWGRLVRSESWGGRPVRRSAAIMGVNGDDHPKGCKITGVAPGYPAAKVGLKVGDIITKLDGKKVTSFQGLVALVGRKKPGDKVTVELIRGTKTLKIPLVLAKR
jgi:serine protease Do